MTRFFIVVVVSALTLSGAVQASETESNSNAGSRSAGILSRSGLPTCVQTIAGSGAAPNWMVRNDCGGPIVIDWCWLKSFPNWKNADNSCAKTGVRSSGIVQEGDAYEFPDRPYSDQNARFPVAAALSVSRVCRTDSSGNCPER